MGKLEDHARREFEAAGWTKGGKFDDEWQKLICDQVVELLTTFSTHGHSGTTAHYALDLFTKLASFKPIAPLTGADDEWVDILGDRGLLQNKRNSSVFKEDGRAYYIDAIVFEERNGTRFTSFESRREVKFPCNPKPKIVAAWKRPWYRLTCGFKRNG